MNEKDGSFPVWTAPVILVVVFVLSVLAGRPDEGPSETDRLVEAAFERMCENPAEYTTGPDALAPQTLREFCEERG